MNIRSSIAVFEVILACTFIENAAYSIGPPIQVHSCDHNANVDKKIIYETEEKIEKTLTRLTNKYSDMDAEAIKSKILLVSKELSIALGKEPSSEQLYRFFKDLREIEKEHRTHPDKTFKVRVNSGVFLFGRWISIGPSKTIRIIYDDANRMYLIFQPKTIGKGAFKTVNKGISYRDEKGVAVISRRESISLKDRNYNARIFEKEKFILKDLQGIHGLASNLGSNSEKIFQNLYLGDLNYFLKKTGKLTPEVQLKILEEISAGLKELQSKGYSHNDIKLDNILFSEGPSGPEFVLADFGLVTRPKDEIENKIDRMMVGTPLYMAPEITLGWLGNNPIEEAENAFKADVYSLGIVGSVLALGSKATAPFIACYEESERSYLECKAEQTKKIIDSMNKLRNLLLRHNKSANSQYGKLLLVEEKTLSVQPRTRLTVSEFNSYLSMIRSGTFDEAEFLKKNGQEEVLDFDDRSSILKTPDQFQIQPIRLESFCR